MIKNNLFFLKKINHIIIIGYHEKLSELKGICDKYNISFEIISSSDQSKKVKNKIKFKVFDKINLKFKNYIKKNFNISNTLFISLGSRMIFKPKDIKNFFKGNLINFHSTRLPYDSGGASTSWKIMRNDRIDNQLVHIIDEGIDTGDIIDFFSSVIPKEFQTPLEIDSFSNRNFLIFFESFIRKIKEKKKFSLLRQPKYIGNYNPRLNTKINGWIDWSLSSNDLINFINAFEDPYTGAKTKIKNLEVSIKKAQLHGGEISNHPFMSGVISRHDNKWIIVSTADKKTIIIEEVLNKKCRNVIQELKVGDRFITPINFLSKAKKRIKYSSRGLKK